MMAVRHSKKLNVINVIDYQNITRSLPRQVCHYVALFQKFVDTTVPSDGDFSFPRFIGLLILSL
jgi:hypothetical protein